MSEDTKNNFVFLGSEVRYWVGPGFEAYLIFPTVFIKIINLPGELVKRQIVKKKEIRIFPSALEGVFTKKP